LQLEEERKKILLEDDDDDVTSAPDPPQYGKNFKDTLNKWGSANAPFIKKSEKSTPSGLKDMCSEEVQHAVASSSSSKKNFIRPDVLKQAMSNTPLTQSSQSQVNLFHRGLNYYFYYKCNSF